MLIRWGLNQSLFFQVQPWKCQLTKTGKLQEGGCDLGISFRGRVLSDRRLSGSLPGELLVDVSFQGWSLGLLAAEAAAPQSPSHSQWPHGSQNTRDKVGSTGTLGALILSRVPFLGLQQQPSCPQISGCPASRSLSFPVQLVSKFSKEEEDHFRARFGGFLSCRRFWNADFFLIFISGVSISFCKHYEKYCMHFYVIQNWLYCPSLKWAFRVTQLPGIWQMLIVNVGSIFCQYNNHILERIRKSHYSVWKMLVINKP